MSKELAAQGGEAIETGGQAFPRAGFEGDTRYGKPHDGMTLRDYFAAKAMQSLVQALIVSGHCSNEQTNIASIAYEHADAMLAERKKGRQVEAVTGEECAEPKSDGWISVNDRLPEKEGLYAVYLVSTEYGGINKDGSVGEVEYDWWRPCYWELSEYWGWGIGGNKDRMELIITHWQPAPQPPASAPKAPLTDAERDKIIAALKAARNRGEK